MHLWRINLKPGRCEAGIDAAEFCIERRILGVGYRVDRVPSDINEYLALGLQKYATDKKRKAKWSATTKAVGCKIGDKDLIWTRNRQGHYYLGKVRGGWEYRDGVDYARADIFNVRGCDWVSVGALDNVPGAVISSFIPARTVQRVKDASALLYSRYLFATLRGEPFVPDPETAQADILELLSADDLEDAAALYLQQRKRLFVYTSTCKTDTMAVECIFTSEDGQRVGLQVKRGNEPIDQEQFASFDGTVYLFQARGIYQGQPNPRCVCLSPDILRSFILEQRRLMPGRVQRWIEFAESQTLIALPG
jgi:hypothetical protein